MIKEISKLTMTSLATVLLMPIATSQTMPSSQEEKLVNQIHGMRFSTKGGSRNKFKFIAKISPTKSHTVSATPFAAKPLDTRENIKFLQGNKFPSHEPALSTSGPEFQIAQSAWKQNSKYVTVDDIQGSRAVLLKALSRSDLPPFYRDNFMSFLAHDDLILGYNQEAFNVAKMQLDSNPNNAKYDKPDLFFGALAAARLGHELPGTKEFIIEYFRNAWGKPRLESEMQYILNDPNSDDADFLGTMLMAEGTGLGWSGRFQASAAAYKMSPDNPLAAYFYADVRKHRDQGNGIAALRKALDDDKPDPHLAWRLNMLLWEYGFGTIPPYPEPTRE